MYCAALNNVPDSIEKWQLAQTLQGKPGYFFSHMNQIHSFFPGHEQIE